MKPVSIFADSPFEVDPLMIDLATVAALLTVSTRTVERMVKTGEFLQPVNLNRRNKRWSRVAVEQWIAGRQAAAVDASSRPTLSMVPTDGA